jgi:hypothetical protein
MHLLLHLLLADTELQPRTKPRGTGMAEDDELQWVSATEQQCLQESVRGILACQVLAGR